MFLGVYCFQYFLHEILSCPYLIATSRTSSGSEPLDVRDSLCFEGFFLFGPRIDGNKNGTIVVFLSYLRRWQIQSKVRNRAENTWGKPHDSKHLLPY